jgi:hypothetical protein
MTFYGSGVLRYPGSERTVHDFEDGPFETLNAEIIRHALNMGYSTEPPPEPVKRGPGRPPKEAKIADEVEGATEVPMVDRPRASKEVREGNAKGKEVAKEKEGE